MLGFVEIITLLLGLAGFGLSPNPNPPTANQALRYAIPDADVIVHVDVASIVHANYKRLLALPNTREIRSSPDLAKAVRQVITQVEGARNLAKGTTGIDFARDISDVTASFQYIPRRDPVFVAAIRGNLRRDLLDKVGAMTRSQPVAVGGGKLLEMGRDKPALAMTKDGVLLAGDARLLRDRLSPSWRPPGRRGTTLSTAWAAIDAHPVFAVSVALSRNARRDIARKMPGKNFVTDLVRRHRAYSFSVYHDGIGWSWTDSSRAGLEQIAMMSEGFIDLLRAAQIAPRGVAKIVLGAITSYRGTNRQIDAIIRRRGDIMKIVQSYTGDGNFKVAVNKDPRRLRLDVRATGKSLSEVVPLGFVGPAMAVGFLTMSGRSSSSVMPMPMPRPPAPPPARVRP